jgi:uncharacterized membrane protein
MEYKNALSFDIKWDYRAISLFIFLLALPNLLGMINLSTPWGFKIHFFQAAVFIAALIYGPFGGMLSGFVGSFYSALIMHNPYIAVGNAILGFFVGLFARHGFNTVIAVLLAYIIQLPWLVATDYYLVHLPLPFIRALVIALAVSNTLWAAVAHYSAKPIKAALR